MSKSLPVWLQQLENLSRVWARDSKHSGHTLCLEVVLTTRRLLLKGADVLVSSAPGDSQPTLGIVTQAITSLASPQPCQHATVVFGPTQDACKLFITLLRCCAQAHNQVSQASLADCLAALLGHIGQHNVELGSAAAEELVHCLSLVLDMRSAVSFGQVVLTPSTIVPCFPSLAAHISDEALLCTLEESRPLNISGGRPSERGLRHGQPAKLPVCKPAALLALEATLVGVVQRVSAARRPEAHWPEAARSALSCVAADVAARRDSQCAAAQVLALCGRAIEAAVDVRHAARFGAADSIMAALEMPCTASSPPPAPPSWASESHSMRVALAVCIPWLHLTAATLQDWQGPPPTCVISALASLLSCCIGWEGVGTGPNVVVVAVPVADAIQDILNALLPLAQVGRDRVCSDDSCAAAAVLLVPAEGMVQSGSSPALLKLALHIARAASEAAPHMGVRMALQGLRLLGHPACSVPAVSLITRILSAYPYMLVFAALTSLPAAEGALHIPPPHWGSGVELSNIEADVFHLVRRLWLHTCDDAWQDCPLDSQMDAIPVTSGDLMSHVQLGGITDSSGTPMVLHMQAPALIGCGASCVGIIPRLGKLTACSILLGSVHESMLAHTFVEAAVARIGNDDLPDLHSKIMVLLALRLNSITTRGAEAVIDEATQPVQTWSEEGAHALATCATHVLHGDCEQRRALALVGALAGRVAACPPGMSLDHGLLLLACTNVLKIGRSTAPSELSLGAIARTSTSSSFSLTAQVAGGDGSSVWTQSGVGDGGLSTPQACSTALARLALGLTVTEDSLSSPAKPSQVLVMALLPQLLSCTSGGGKELAAIFAALLSSSLDVALARAAAALSNPVASLRYRTSTTSSAKQAGQALPPTSTYVPVIPQLLEACRRTFYFTTTLFLSAVGSVGTALVGERLACVLTQLSEALQAGLMLLWVHERHVVAPYIFDYQAKHTATPAGAVPAMDKFVKGGASSAGGGGAGSKRGRDDMDESSTSLLPAPILSCEALCRFLRGDASALSLPRVLVHSISLTLVQGDASAEVSTRTNAVLATMLASVTEGSHGSDICVVTPLPTGPHPPPGADSTCAACASHVTSQSAQNWTVHAKASDRSASLLAETRMGTMELLAALDTGKGAHQPSAPSSEQVGTAFDIHTLPLQGPHDARTLRRLPLHAEALQTIARSSAGAGCTEDTAMTGSSMLLLLRNSASLLQHAGYARVRLAATSSPSASQQQAGLDTDGTFLAMALTAVTKGGDEVNVSAGQAALVQFAGYAHRHDVAAPPLAGVLPLQVSIRAVFRDLVPALPTPPPIVRLNLGYHYWMHNTYSASGPVRDAPAACCATEELVYGLRALARTACATSIDAATTAAEQVLPMRAIFRTLVDVSAIADDEQGRIGPFNPVHWLSTGVPNRLSPIHAPQRVHPCLLRAHNPADGHRARAESLRLDEPTRSCLTPQPSVYVAEDLRSSGRPYVSLAACVLLDAWLRYTAHLRWGGLPAAVVARLLDARVIVAEQFLILASMHGCTPLGFVWMLRGELLPRLAAPLLCPRPDRLVKADRTAPLPVPASTPPLLDDFLSQLCMGEESAATFLMSGLRHILPALFVQDGGREEELHVLAFILLRNIPDMLDPADANVVLHSIDPMPNSLSIGMHPPSQGLKRRFSAVEPLGGSTRGAFQSETLDAGPTAKRMSRPSIDGQSVLGPLPTTRASLGGSSGRADDEYGMSDFREMQIKGRRQLLGIVLMKECAYAVLARLLLTPMPLVFGQKAVVLWATHLASRSVSRIASDLFDQTLASLAWHLSEEDSDSPSSRASLALRQFAVLLQDSPRMAGQPSTRMLYRPANIRLAALQLAAAKLAEGAAAAGVSSTAVRSGPNAAGAGSLHAPPPPSAGGDRYALLIQSLSSGGTGSIGAALPTGGKTLVDAKGKSRSTQPQLGAAAVHPSAALDWHSDVVARLQGVALSPEAQYAVTIGWRSFDLSEHVPDVLLMPALSEAARYLLELPDSIASPSSPILDTELAKVRDKAVSLLTPMEILLQRYFLLLLSRISTVVAVGREPIPVKQRSLLVLQRVMLRASGGRPGSMEGAGGRAKLDKHVPAVVAVLRQAMAHPGTRLSAAAVWYTFVRLLSDGTLKQHLAALAVGLLPYCEPERRDMGGFAGMRGAGGSSSADPDLVDLTEDGPEDGPEDGGGWGGVGGKGRGRDAAAAAHSAAAAVEKYDALVRSELSVLLTEAKGRSLAVAVVHPPPHPPCRPLDSVGVPVAAGVGGGGVGGVGASTRGVLPFQAIGSSISSLWTDADVLSTCTASSTVTDFAVRVLRYVLVDKRTVLHGSYSDVPALGLGQRGAGTGVGMGRVSPPLPSLEPYRAMLAREQERELAGAVGVAAAGAPMLSQQSLTESPRLEPLLYVPLRLAKLVPLLRADSEAVVQLALAEVEAVLTEQVSIVHRLTLAGTPEGGADPVISDILKALMEVARTSTQNASRQACAVCLGQLGAIAPASLAGNSGVSLSGAGAAAGPTTASGGQTPGYGNLTELPDRCFVLESIRSFLVKALRAAPTASVQDKVAFALQQLLRLYGRSNGIEPFAAGAKAKESVAVTAKPQVSTNQPRSAQIHNTDIGKGQTKAVGAILPGHDSDDDGDGTVKSLRTGRSGAAGAGSRAGPRLSSSGIGFLEDDRLDAVSYAMGADDTGAVPIPPALRDMLCADLKVLRLIESKSGRQDGVPGDDTEEAQVEALQTLLDVIAPYWSSNLVLGSKDTTPTPPSLYVPLITGYMAEDGAGNRAITGTAGPANVSPSQQGAQSTFDAWLAAWARWLMATVSRGEAAAAAAADARAGGSGTSSSFPNSIRRQDLWGPIATVVPLDPPTARFILPFVVRDALDFGSEDLRRAVASEIHAVLAGPSSSAAMQTGSSAASGSGAGSSGSISSGGGTVEYRATHTVFALIDTMKRWRTSRLEEGKAYNNLVAQYNARKPGSSHPGPPPRSEGPIQKLLAGLPSLLLVQAARRIHAHARALFYLEHYLRKNNGAPFQSARVLDSAAGITDGAVGGILSGFVPYSRADLYDMQAIYSGLDEPDGMSAIATLRSQLLERSRVQPAAGPGAPVAVGILQAAEAAAAKACAADPLLALRERVIDAEHEARWTDALLCYEQALEQAQGRGQAGGRAHGQGGATSTSDETMLVGLDSSRLRLGRQHAAVSSTSSINESELHSGLLTCLKNVGHMQTAMNHAIGVLGRRPDLAPAVTPHAVEAAWRLGAWEPLQQLLAFSPSASTISLGIGQDAGVVPGVGARSVDIREDYSTSLGAAMFHLHEVSHGQGAGPGQGHGHNTQGRGLVGSPMSLLQSGDGSRTVALLTSLARCTVLGTVARVQSTAVSGPSSKRRKGDGDASPGLQTLPSAVLLRASDPLTSGNPLSLLMNLAPTLSIAGHDTGQGQGLAGTGSGSTGPAGSLSLMPVARLSSAALVGEGAPSPAAAMHAALASARSEALAGLAAASTEGYSRAYPFLLRLHGLREVERAGELMTLTRDRVDRRERLRTWEWAHRIRLTQTSMAQREPLLALRRALYRIFDMPELEADAWLELARAARAAGHASTATYALLHASVLGADVAQLQSAKLLAAQGLPHRALLELEPVETDPAAVVAEHQAAKSGVQGSSTASDAAARAALLAGKKLMHTTRWMAETRTASEATIVKRYRCSIELCPDLEKGHFLLGSYFDGLLRVMMGEKPPDFNPREATSSGALIKTWARRRDEYVRQVVKEYGESLARGHRYISQSFPRLLTLYCDYGAAWDLMAGKCEEVKHGVLTRGVKDVTLPRPLAEADVTLFLPPEVSGRSFPHPDLETSMKLDAYLRELVYKIPVHRWYTVLPQLSSRLCHRSGPVQTTVANVLTNLLVCHPHQAAWGLVGLSKSRIEMRKSRSVKLIGFAKSTILKKIASQSGTQGSPNPAISALFPCMDSMFDELIAAACRPKEPVGVSQYNLAVGDKTVFSVAHVLVPLLSYLTLNLPRSSAGSLSSDGRSGYKGYTHAAAESPGFTSSAPWIQKFDSSALVMKSAERPTRVSVLGSDSRHYFFLCKREIRGDLRKDSRTMETGSLVNRILNKNPEGRRRRLRMRTYAVVTLNEECGLLEWMNNTSALRHEMGAVLRMCTNSAGQPLDMNDAYKKVMAQYKWRDTGSDPPVPGGGQRWYASRLSTADRVKVYREVVLPQFPPVFHRWFPEQFPDPSAWFEARVSFARSTAVWSMLGHILGLGDRHGENLLIDKKTGEICHVDFDCIFDKGAILGQPEIVPFRLTPSLLDALGLAGYEGVFRRVAETAMGVLRGNKELLLSALESFVHDPLVEWAGKGKAGQDGAGALGGAVDTLSSADVDSVEGVRMLKRVRERLEGEYNNGPEYSARMQWEVEAKKRAANAAAARGATAGAAHATTPPSSTSSNALEVRGQVHRLLKEATSDENLSCMYVGWMPFL